MLGNFHEQKKKFWTGIIMSQIKDRNKLENIVHRSFHLNDLIDYEIIEFIPTMTSEDFENAFWKPYSRNQAETITQKKEFKFSLKNQYQGINQAENNC
ncbi:MAG: hypothetical protein R2757_12120 [Draconibacterium sp.]